MWLAGVRRAQTGAVHSERDANRIVGCVVDDMGPGTENDWL